MKQLIFTLTISFFATCFVQAQLTNKPLGTTTAANGYIEYLPAAYTSNPNQKLPIILFFHGSGENGNGTTDLYKVFNTGLPQIIQNNSWTYKNQFVVLMPQHVSTNPNNLCPSANEVRNFIDYARKAYNVDTLQLYITGLSCGGNGVWDFIGAYPSNEKVAAAVPISTNGTKASREGKAGCTKAIPTWAFHGTSDTTSPWANDVTANNFFNACPEPHAEAKLTLYPGVAHDAWTQTYNLSSGNDIYAWLLLQKSPSNAPNGIATVKEDKNKINTFPNPFSNELTVKVESVESQTMRLLVTDMIGKQVYVSNQYSTNQEVKLGKELPDGVFLIRAEFANQVSDCKVVKLKN